MSNMVDSILSHIGDDQVAAIAAKLGTDPAQARNAIEHAIPLIVGGMAQNASNPQGAGALHDALGAHAGFDVSSVLGNLLGNNSNAQSIGGAILGNVFGGNQGAANSGLGQVTGLGQQNAGQLMAILAPIVMAYLANHVQNNGIDPGGLGGMLGQQSQQMQQGGGLVGGLLNAVLNHSGGNLDLSNLVSGASSVLGAFGRR
jgi:hypothetical protein